MSNSEEARQWLEMLGKVTKENRALVVERDKLKRMAEADQTQIVRLTDELAEETKRASQAEDLVQYIALEADRLNISS